MQCTVASCGSPQQFEQKKKDFRENIKPDCEKLKRKRTDKRQMEGNELQIIIIITNDNNCRALA